MLHPLSFRSIRWGGRLDSFSQIVEPPDCAQIVYVSTLRTLIVKQELLVLAIFSQLSPDVRQLGATFSQL